MFSSYDVIKENYNKYAAFKDNVNMSRIEIVNNEVFETILRRDGRSCNRDCIRVGLHKHCMSRWCDSDYSTDDE